MSGQDASYNPGIESTPDGGFYSMTSIVHSNILSDTGIDEDLSF
jgi:hypothetical protein